MNGNVNTTPCKRSRSLRPVDGDELWHFISPYTRIIVMIGGVEAQEGKRKAYNPIPDLDFD